MRVLFLTSGLSGCLTLKDGIPGTSRFLSFRGLWRSHVALTIQVALTSSWGGL